ncbi:MAG TPA: aldo/keto reductase, partial [Armatimonadota bacterium]|nr:aldo/keto reductase [Armatimonadota bacterium]
MELTRLGRTDLMVTRTSFGVLPLQRVEMEEATRILRKAFDAGINFYDTARSYTDSEEKIGYALSDVRDSI